MTLRSRADLLMDLADAVMELTEPRRPETRYDVPSVSKKGKRTITRETHRVVLPSLLDSLVEAAEPSVDGEILAVGSFESQPSADMGAIAAFQRIKTDAHAWQRIFTQPKTRTTAEAISGLVSADHSYGQLLDLLKDAKSWVRTARIATGYDPPARTVDIPCPHCSRPHSLTMFGEDLELIVRCSSCKVDWPAEHIGLLTRQIEANLTQTTLTDDGPCPISPGCYRRGDHDEHWNSRGNTWLTPDEMKETG